MRENQRRRRTGYVAKNVSHHFKVQAYLLSIFSISMSHYHSKFTNMSEFCVSWHLQNILDSFVIHPVENALFWGSKPEAKKRAEKKDAEANHNFHFRPTQTSIMKEKPVVCLSASWGGSVYGEVRIQVDLCIWQYLISTSPLSHAIVFILSDAISLLRCRSARSRRCVAWRRCWWRSLQGCLSSPSPVDCNRRNTRRARSMPQGDRVDSSMKDSPGLFE